jgi:outer membrane protein assembly factor BamB
LLDEVFGKDNLFCEQGGRIPVNGDVMKRITALLIGAAVLLAPHAKHCRAESAREALERSGVQGGIIVHVGVGGGEETLSLHASDSFLVHGLDTDPATVKTARAHILSKGRYGKVSISLFDGKHLPYISGSINLVVDQDGTVAGEEIMRVLAPAGTAMIRGKKLTKPVPPDIDDWSHFRQGPENNPVAADTVVAPPRSIQWTTGPRWLRSHEVPSGITSMVTAGGRLFYTLDEGPVGIVDGRFPEKWSLLARDAYNGTMLWKIPLPKWGWQTWNPNLRGANMTATRGLRTRTPHNYIYRMVADSERLYFTLGNTAPVSIIDAATGKVIATCPHSNAPNKLILSGGVLIAILDTSFRAYDSKTGEELWHKDTRNTASIAAQGDRLLYHAGSKELTCLDIKTGEPRWTKPLAVVGGISIANGTVLASGSGMEALSLETGETLWVHKGRGKGPNYIIGDTIWHGYRGERTDLKTGKQLQSLSVNNLWSPQHHHRCYSNKATSRFIIGAMEGMEFLDVQSDEHSRNNWVRGACQVGIMPANGMSYVPPDQCFCSAGVKILGFNALVGTRTLPSPVSPAQRLHKGLAYGKITAGPSAGEGDWPEFRHDSRRSGGTAIQVPAKLKPGWTLQLNGSLTQPVAVGDLLCVASRDTHTLHAIDAKTGRQRWTFTADGRIDSPPALFKGMVLFGSADGHVYCLRASDGELAWRFRAAPHHRFCQSFGQLESVWPVHGSVLILDGLAYASAGRSTFLDDGIYLYALDPVTGAVIHQHQETGPYEDHTKDHGHSFWSEGARNDVLVTDGEAIYIMQLRFTAGLKPFPAKTESLLGDRKLGRHIFATSGFLDDEWYNRTFWMNSNIWPGFYLANQASKSGQLLVSDSDTTYGIKAFWTRNRHSPMFFPEEKGYLLFADANDNEPILVGRDEGKAVTWLPEFDIMRGGNDAGKKFGPALGSAPQLSDVNAYTYNKDKGIGFTRTKKPKWTAWVPIRVKAMVSTSGNLFIAGAPDELDENDPLAALEGRGGAVLRAVSSSDGETLAEYRLDSPPVLDGLIAVPGRLYIATRDRKISCWQE